MPSARETQRETPAFQHSVNEIMKQNKWKTKLRLLPTQLHNNAPPPLRKNASSSGPKHFTCGQNVLLQQMQPAAGNASQGNLLWMIEEIV